MEGEVDFLELGSCVGDNPFDCKPLMTIVPTVCAMGLDFSMELDNVSQILCFDDSDISGW